MKKYHCYWQTSQGEKKLQENTMNHFMPKKLDNLDKMNSSKQTLLKNRGWGNAP